MMNTNRISENLKANLFELTYTIDEYTRKDMMNMLCERLKKILDASNIVFYMYNKKQLNEQITYFSSQYPVSVKTLSPSRFIAYFKEKTNITVVNEENPITQKSLDQMTFLLKVYCKENFSGFMFITFSEDQIVSLTTLEKVRIIIEQFLSILYHKRHQMFLRERNQLLFQLSTKLHSVHQTIEVLERFYETIQLIYPTFRYYLLMSQEYENETLPIKMIEYTGGATLSPGTLAFINNELQIEYNEVKKETNIYSPLSGKQGVYGVLQINIQQIVTMIDEEVNFITQFTNMVGRAIERTTLYQSSTQLVSDLQIINVASHDLNLNLDQNEITDTVKKHIFESCHPEQVGVIFFSQEREESLESFDILDGSTEYFTTQNGIHFVCHVYEKMKQDPKPILSGNFQAEGIDTLYNSIMIIPMWSSESIFGVIIVAHHIPYYFSFDKFKFIQSFVQHASLAFHNSVLKEQLKQTAITDYLTKLYSRNHLDKKIGEQMSRSGKGAFILFDVDDFKLVNDTFGHYIGDKVLIQVAEIIKLEMKQGEIAARWGGEEFAVYLPHCSLAEATERANRIREKVIKTTQPQVTLSSGVSTWTSAKKDTVEQLFIRTDEALYEAKTSGKNKVVQHK